MAALIGTPGVGAAFELGDAVIGSSLGQPLEISVPYRLASGEQLAPGCVGLVQSPGASSLPAYTSAGSVVVGPTHIRVVGTERVREPLIAVNLSVRCPMVPHIVRSYQLFVDPPVASGAPLVRMAAAPAAVLSPASSGTAATEAERPRVAAAAAPTERVAVPAAARIEQGTAYRVVRGDTLSGIAARVAGRPGNVWQTAATILAANAEAFPDGNPDRLREGTSLTIPELGPRLAVEDTGARAAAPVAAPTQASAVAAPNFEAPGEPPATVITQPAEVSANSGSVLEEPVAVAQPVAVTPPAAVARVPAVTPVAEDPVVAVQQVEPAPATPTSYWLSMLLAFGAGLAVASAAFVFARRLRAREEEPPAADESRVRAVRAHAPARTIPTTDGIKVEYPTAAVAPAATELVDREPEPVIVSEWTAELPQHAQPARHVSASATDDSQVAPRPVEDTLTRPAVIIADDVLSPTVTGRVQPGETTISRLRNASETTMTVDVEVPRKGYELEPTLTPEQSAELANAMLDLEATKTLAANEEATTMLPQPTEIQTARLKRRARGND